MTGTPPRLTIAELEQLSEDDRFSVAKRAIADGIPPSLRERVMTVARNFAERYTP